MNLKAMVWGSLYRPSNHSMNYGSRGVSGDNRLRDTIQLLNLTLFTLRVSLACACHVKGASGNRRWIWRGVSKEV